MSRRIPRLLVTGFEPFGDDSDNPSARLIEALDGRRLDGHRVTTALLPVTFDGALAAVTAAVERERPRLALATGLAGGRARLSLERVAINLVDARIPDNAGRQPVDAPVLAYAPPAYFTTLPVKAMLRAIHEAGVPAELSLSAGSYVCNAVFFALRHLAETRLPTMRAGFLHLPWLPEQAACRAGAPSMALETIVLGVEAALQTALRHPQDLDAPGGTIS